LGRATARDSPARAVRIVWLQGPRNLRSQPHSAAGAAQEHAPLRAHAIGAAWSEAYRSGGSPDSRVVGEYAPATLDPEEPWWRGRRRDDRLGLRVGAFRTGWRDRTSINGSIGAAILEPFAARIDGAAVEVGWSPGEPVARRDLARATSSETRDRLTWRWPGPG